MAGVEFGVQYEGLRELLQALRVVQGELYLAVTEGLRTAGGVIRESAREKFIAYGASSGSYEHQSPTRNRSFTVAASGFRVMVRPNTSRMPIVGVGQSLRRSGDMPRRRSNFGDLMMRHALLPARTESLAEVESIVDVSVTGLLREHGF